MIRRKPMVRGSRSGRRPATLKRVSAKRRRSKLGTKADPVYQDVDRRSRGLCEVEHGRGPHRAEEHHHVYKPRVAFHDVQWILHVCRAAHREFERPYKFGRRVLDGFDRAAGRFRTKFITCADKWAARAQGA